MMNANEGGEPESESARRGGIRGTLVRVRFAACTCQPWAWKEVHDRSGLLHQLGDVVPLLLEVLVLFVDLR
jgi:hypothetical protein